jgi:co-chaperonin GroES (HSP10)
MNAAMKTQEQEHAELMDLAFPNVDPEFKPFGTFVLIQIRTPKMASKGGIALLQDARDTEYDNTQVAKVIALGPVAYKNRTTLEPWPEGDWVKPGVFVRAPKYGGDRFRRPIPGRNGEWATFVTCKDLELTGEHTGDPLDVAAYL